MSHLRSNCANCGQPKDDLYEPYCVQCNNAVEAVREYADKQEIGNALYYRLKDEALDRRRSERGMAGKMKPNGEFERAPNPAEVQQSIADQVRVQEEGMLNLRKRYGV